MIEQSLPRLQGPNNVQPWARQLIDDLNVRLRALTQARVTSADAQYGYLSGKIVAGSNVSLTVLNPGGDEQLEISASGGVSAHDILSATHTDVVVASRLRGDLLVANSTPAWARFPLGGLNTVLKSGANDPVWGTIAHSELTGIGANDHHAQSHVLATDTGLGTDHTMSALAVGHVLRASSTTAAAFAALNYTDLAGSVPAHDHGIHTGLTDDDHAIYLLLSGRTGTTNDPVISTGATGSIYGSDDASGILRLFSTNHATRGTVDVMHQARLIPSSLTLTAASTNLLDVGTGGLTLNGVTSLRVLNFTPAITVDADMTQTTHLFRHGATWNLGALTEQLGQLHTFTANPTIVPNSGLPLVSMSLRGLVVQPVLSNSGASNVGLAHGVLVGGTLNASWELSEWIGLKMDNPLGGAVSTIDDLIGIDIGALVSRSSTTVAALRSAITAATEQYFLKDTGGAKSEFAGLFTRYNNIALVSNGVPSLVAEVNLTGQTAAIALTTLYTPPANGKYRVVAECIVTTRDPVSSSLGGFAVTYTDVDTNTSLNHVPAGMTAATGNAVGTRITGSTFIHAKSGVAIQYNVNYASNTPGTMTYAVRIRLEAL